MRLMEFVKQQVGCLELYKWFATKPRLVLFRVLAASVCFKINEAGVSYLMVLLVLYLFQRGVIKFLAIFIMSIVPE